ncbi:MAG: hypothetical protein ABI887_16200 [Burkholderiales bacterium]
MNKRRTIATLTEALDSQRRLMLLGLGTMPLHALLTACGSSPGSADASASASGSSNTDASAGTDTSKTATAQGFTHPGLMHTEADFARVREKIAAGAQPWAAGWNALTSSGRASVSATPNPLETVVRGGDGENFRNMVEDLERAYQFAVHWKVSGDTAYADRAVARPPSTPAARARAARWSAAPAGAMGAMAAMRCCSTARAGISRCLPAWSRMWATSLSRCGCTGMPRRPTHACSTSVRATSATWR